MTHLLFSCPLNHLIFRLSVIIQHDKARSASDRPATRDAQHPESGVLNSYAYLYKPGFSSQVWFLFSSMVSLHKDDPAVEPHA
jgi:hypothetical protein